MHQEGYVVALLSGELDVTQRATILKRFRDGKERVLVTTNVCARGIDVEQVTLVVNFDLPMTKVCFFVMDFKESCHSCEKKISVADFSKLIPSWAKVSEPVHEGKCFK